MIFLKEETPLHLAVKGNVVLVKSLLKSGASPIFVDNHGNSPIDFASQEIKSIIFEYLNNLEQDLKIDIQNVKQNVKNIVKSTSPKSVHKSTNNYGI